MHRDPALSYRGALAVLKAQKYELIEILDRASGGLLVGGGVAAPVLLGLIDPKNEVFRILKQLLPKITERLLHTGGLARIESITAAHSILVVSAFSDALRACVGERPYSQLKLSRRERVALITDQTQIFAAGRRMLDALVENGIPLPSPRQGWHETVNAGVSPWVHEAAARTLGFLEKLEVWPKLALSTPRRSLPESITLGAVERYQDQYLKLAAEVPEFLVWATLGEHAATRTHISSVSDPLREVLTEQSRSLARLERLLTDVAPNRHATDSRTTLARMNAAVLRRPLVSTDALQHMDGVRFPEIAEGYVTPAFRMATMSPIFDPGSEQAWSDFEPRDDLDNFLAACVQDWRCLSQPLLVLGHPGAGKSLFTKVIAARLPSPAFTTIRVPLRTVDANAAVHHQIEQALQQESNGRITWSRLADESHDVVRVVLLDGLDELIQATGVAQSDYLQRIAEFQQRELELGWPTVAVVTSRTLVSSRVRVPDGSIILKIEDFNAPRIAQWLDRWRAANSDGIAAGTFRVLTPQAAMHHIDLARQPLLLLLLALYAADPETPDLGDRVLSTATLYQGLLANFVRREVGKGARGTRQPTGDPVDDQMWYLGLTAFAMFNRGRQQISETELDSDLSVFPRPGTPTVKAGSLDQPTSHAQQIVSRFFFVYASEADAHRALDVRRVYEFLHATFGEFLVAATTVRVLLRTAAQQAAARQAPYLNQDQHNPLGALLSHQPFLKRPTIITFARELVCELRTAETMTLRDCLDQLISDVDGLIQSPVFSQYDPSKVGPISRLAAYSINLVAIRAMFDGGMPLRAGSRDASHRDWFSRAVRLWHAGLDDDGWDAAVSTLRVCDLPPTLRLAEHALSAGLREPDNGNHPTDDHQHGLVETIESRVMASSDRVKSLRLGLIAGEHLLSETESPWIVDIAASIMKIMMKPKTNELSRLYNNVTFTDSQLGHTTGTILLECLARDCEYLSPELIALLLSKMTKVANPAGANIELLARILATHPQLFERLPQQWISGASPATWTRNIVSALLTHPGQWPDDLEKTIEIVGETVVRVTNLLSVSPLHPGEASNSRE